MRGSREILDLLLLNRHSRSLPDLWPRSSRLMASHSFQTSGCCNISWRDGLRYQSRRIMFMTISSGRRSDQRILHMAREKLGQDHSVLFGSQISSLASRTSRFMNERRSNRHQQWKGRAVNSSSMSASSDQSGGSANLPRANDTGALSQGSAGQKTMWIPKTQGYATAGLKTLAGKAAQIECEEELEDVKVNSQQDTQKIKGALAQAQLRATFYPKFENEKSDQEVRLKMIDVVHTRKGVLEVSLKHSGSLFMYAGDHGGAFAKNSFGNLYSAVGVFVLGTTFKEAWGAQATEKQRDFNALLEKHHLCISMELVTAVLGDHGQRPIKDYVVVTAVTDLEGKPRFYSTPDLIAFCRQWRLPTNHVWLFSSRKSATSFFTAYDALCEEGTASTVSKILDEIADVSVPATKSHMEVQGEILEGLVARIVSPQSTELLQNVLQRFPFVDFEGQEFSGPSLREICAANKASEQEQVKALLQNIGPDMCSDWSDWMAHQADKSVFSKLLQATPVDQMTTKVQEMIHVLRDRKMLVRYPCHLKQAENKDGKIQFKLTIHVISDNVFRRYQKEMRNQPGLWPLYRGFFVDVCLFDDVSSTSTTPEVNSLSGKVENGLHVNMVEDDVLADEAENLMLKLKFLTYKIRTFLIRNGLSILFNTGFEAYRKYYLRQMEIWGTSREKQRELDQLLNEWAGYITKKCGGKKLNDRIYLSEAEPFLERYAQRSVKNKRLVGAAGTFVNTEDFLADLVIGSHIEEDEDEVVSEHDHQLRTEVDTGKLSRTDATLKAKGILVFFPGIPGCAKSALCKELLSTAGDLGNGKPVQSFMGDLIKGKYWPKLAEERKRKPSMITLADKNAPNEEVWKQIEEMCQTTSAVGVPVVPDSEGTSSNPFSLDTLAVFIYRVLQRFNHPGNLDRDSRNAGYVLLMFYNLYEGKDRMEFEESLKRRFGYLVKMPVLRLDRAAMPPPVSGLLTEGLELYKRHTAKHGKLDSTKGSFREQWSRWETRLRNIFYGNAEHLEAIQVPFEEVVQSVGAQLQAISQGDNTLHIPVEGERTFRTVTYAAVSVPPNEVIDLIKTVSHSNEIVQKYFCAKSLETKLKAAHVTLAHKRSHGVPAVAAYGALCGSKVPIQFTAFLFTDKMCALEANICPSSDLEITSKNEWPHLTVWTAEGTRPKEANDLPQLVSQGQASRWDFPTPMVLSGVVSLL